MTKASLQLNRTDQRDPTRAPSLPANEDAKPRFVSAEVNLLRLPLFALQTKGLRQLDGFECRGTITRNKQSHQYTWRVTRHATRPFPGPLARAAHLGLLSILRDQSTPLQNPVSWSWRDLCRRIDISCSGRTVSHLKEAIRATAGVIIESSQCIYSKQNHDFIELAEEDRRLYVRVRFYSKRHPTGASSDHNSVWLAQWYLDNLNALYTAPLDHELWRYLDRRSPIASRMYEYLLPNMYRPGPYLRINYPLLAQSLPVRIERYYSDARKQIGPALELLSETDVLDKATWARTKPNVAQIRLYRGARLASAVDRAPKTLPSSAQPVAELSRLRTLRHPKAPEAELVADFYRRRWGRGLYRPSTKELARARQLIDDFGPTKAVALVPLLADRLKNKWPDAKTFMAVDRYVSEVSDEYERDRQRDTRRRKERLREHKRQRQLDQKQANRRHFQATWQAEWDQLPANDQQAIRTELLDNNPSLSKMPSVLQLKCLEELARRTDGEA